MRYKARHQQKWKNNLIYVVIVIALASMIFGSLAGCHPHGVADQPVSVEVAKVGDEVYFDSTMLFDEYAPDGNTIKNNVIGTRERVVHLAKSQIGVRELTGNNDGPEVEAFLKSCGLGKGYAWCAAFIKWVFIHAGYPNIDINALAASCYKKMYAVYRNNELYSEPRGGDLVTFYYVNRGTVGHTGMYYRRVNDKFYESIEGNTNRGGGRDGDGVRLMRRSFKATFGICDYIHDSK